MVQAMEGAIVGTSDGSRSSRRIEAMDNQDLVEGTCKRWFRMQSKERASDGSGSSQPKER